MEKLTGYGAPHNHLVGEVGQHYEDLNTGDIYECRIAQKYSPTHGWPVGGYVWELRAKGEEIKEIYGSSGQSSGTALPVVGLLEADEEGIELSEDETTQVNNALNSEMCIIYITDNTAFFPAICRVMKEAGLIAGVSYNWHENTWYQIGIRADVINEAWLAFASPVPTE